MKSQVYTEVAMKVNPGPGTWGFVAYDGRTRLFGNYHSFQKETSNRAKLMAVLGAIKGIELRNESLECYTINTNYKVLADALEYGWLVSWAANGWKNKQGKPIDNEDLWKEILLKAQEGLEVKWVKKNAFRYKLPRKVSRHFTRQ